MSVDYRKYKTPFYEVEIGDATGQRLVKLPHHVLRLLQKVEITEPLGRGEQEEFTTINLSFIEGSREPASPDASLGTSGLYKIPVEGNKTDMDIAGSLTNRTGVLTDLRFSGSGGITFLTEGEKKAGKVDSTIQKNVDGKKTTRKFKTEAAAPVFLFQERNQVKVTWGYKEDPSSVRSIRARIIMVKVEYPEGDSVRTTITCQDTGAFLDQIATSKGIPFGKRITTPKGNSIITFEDLPTDQLLRDISTKAGMAVIISKNLPAEKHDADRQKMWIAGESFTQFIGKLAEVHNCYWRIIPDSKTGKDTLVFIKKPDFESKTLNVDKTALIYKAPGALIKSVNINVDFGAITGNAQKSLDENGQVVEDNSYVNVQLLAAHKGSKLSKSEEYVNADPNSTNPVPAVVGVTENIAKGDVAGHVSNTARSDKGALSDISQSQADIKSRIIQLEFTTIGWTKLTPGIVEIGGIGVRYSGRYRIMSVTHTIDQSGYITKCSATSQFLPGGGTKPSEASSVKEDEKVEVRLLKDKNNPDQASILDQYHKFNGTA